RRHEADEDVRQDQLAADPPQQLALRGDEQPEGEVRETNRDGEPADRVDDREEGGKRAGERANDADRELDRDTDDDRATRQRAKEEASNAEASSHTWTSRY